ncbi:hypothetical protein GOP47_0023585 [Adiantum capillus-veneris]|uniref:Uncharacterized protein n=1 Tax=Adiantum capillus-veneris TaxID=13818 RepID=A0A9D4U4S7_ADICA|nr:hypothetical protein GOP47_0023585 [Adiantum capillus-veneris]
MRATAPTSSSTGRSSGELSRLSSTASTCSLLCEEAIEECHIKARVAAGEGNSDKLARAKLVMHTEYMEGMVREASLSSSHGTFEDQFLTKSQFLL